MKTPRWPSLTLPLVVAAALLAWTGDARAQPAASGPPGRTLIVGIDANPSSLDIQDAQTFQSSRHGTYPGFDWRHRFTSVASIRRQ